LKKERLKRAEGYATLQENCVRKGMCLLWTGRPDEYGYGKIYYSDTYEYAHEFAWCWDTGKPIPEGYIVHQKCENDLCINPSHLYLVREDLHLQSGEDREGIELQQT